jgi:hypothetical protein
MAYAIEYLPDEEIILITNRGLFTFDDFARQAREALEVTQRYHCKRLLVDCTAIITQADLYEIFNSPRVYEEMAAPRTNRVALLAPEDQHSREDIKFYETVCVNRGWLVRIFAQRSDAVHWLHEYFIPMGSSVR